MRRGRQVDCSTCDAAWSARRDRFCGHCGAALAIVEAPRPPRPRRRVTVHLLGVAAVATAGVLVAAGVRVEGEAVPTDTGVEVPEADEVTPGRGPVGSERAAALAPFEGVPDPFDRSPPPCEPEGCLRWQRDLPRREDQWSRMTAVTDRIALLEQDRIVLIEAATGEEVLDEVVGGVLRGPAAAEHVPWQPEGGIFLASAGDPETPPDEFVIMDGRGVVQLRSADGHVRWTVTTGFRGRPWVRLAGDVLVLSGTPDGDPGLATNLVALDLDDGQVLWRRRTPGYVDGVSERGIVTFVPFGFPDPDGDGAADETSYAEVIDPASGEATLVVDVPHDGWLAELGPWLVVRRDATTAAATESSRLLHAPVDGSVVEVPGHPGDEALEIAGHVVMVLWHEAPRHDERRPAGDVVALDRAGTVVWRQPLHDGEAFLACCETFWAAGHDAVAVRAGPQVTEPIVLDVRTGEPRHDLVAPAPARDGVWWWAADIFVTWAHDGQQIVHVDGRSATLPGHDHVFDPLLTDPLVVVAEQTLFGLDLVPHR